MRRQITAVLLAALCTLGATPKPPPYLPDEWDWPTLCAPRQSHCVVTGGDVRLKYEHYFNRSWDPRQGSNADLTHRELFWADAHDGRLRIFVEAEQSAQWGAHVPLDPTWTDGFATPSAYASYAFGGSVLHPAAQLYIGRQLLAYGAHRMIDDREGLNTLQAYDGARIRVQRGAWTADAFAVRPVQVAPGSFDDGEVAHRSLFGLYASKRVAANTLDFYALGDQRATQFSWSGTHGQRRYSLGLHTSAIGRRFDQDTEVAYQFGSFGAQRISAYLVEGDVGLRWSAGSSWYRASVGAGIASGNHVSATTATSFQAPNPTGYTLGILAANGPQNISGFAPGIEWHHNALSVAAKSYFYFRQSTTDGLYTTGGTPLRAPNSAAAVVGNLSFVTATNAFNRQLTGSLSAARYGTGPFLLASGPAKNVPSAPTTYYSTSLEYRF